MSGQSSAIIFVPGIRPKPPADRHEAELKRCLAAGLKRLPMDEAQAVSIASLLDVVGWSWHFYGIHKDIEIDRAGIERLLTINDDPERVAREAVSPGRRLTGALYAFADKFPTLSGYFQTRRMETRVHEVRRYFSNRNGEADALRSMVVKKLRLAWNENKRVMLIGHSFGSVIAYDALWELSHSGGAGNGNTGQVDMFVSMGSPLTLRFIRQHIKGVNESGSMRYPTNIKRWINFAAIGEVTALDRKLADCFGEMCDLGLLDSIEDDLKVLNQFRDPDGLNVHKCYGYMATTAACSLISEWCGANIGNSAG